MGTYLTIEVVDKNGERVASLGANKGSSGFAAYAFTQEDLRFILGKAYFYHTSIENAVCNIKEVLNDMESIELPDLDEWSRKSLKLHISKLKDGLQSLKRFEGQDRYLTVDESEFMWIYTDDTSKTPSAERDRQWSYLKNIAKGLYNGKFLSSREKEKQEEHKRTLTAALNSQDWISGVDYFGTAYDPKHIMAGDEVISRFSYVLRTEALKTKGDFIEKMHVREQFENKLKEFVRPLGVSIDENTTSKYGGSQYKLVQGLKTILQQADFAEMEKIEAFLRQNQLSEYDYEEGSVFIELYSPLKNKKLDSGENQRRGA